MRTRFITSILLAMLLTACSSSPTTDDDAPVQQTAPPPGDEGPPAMVVDRSQWSDERRELEERLVTFVEEEAPSFNDALQQGSAALEQSLDIWEDRTFEFEAEFANYTEANYGDADIEGWASLRLGQMYLEMACQFRSMEHPAEATSEQVTQFDQVIASQTRPLLVKSNQFLHHAVNNGSDPWDEGARELHEVVVDFEDDPYEACRQARRYW